MVRTIGWDVAEMLTILRDPRIGAGRSKFKVR